MASLCYSAPSHPVVVEAFRDVNGKSLNLGNIRDGSYTGVRVSPSLLNFTADNWSTQQFFTVTAGDSDPGRYIIIHGLTSFDLDYDSGRHFTGPRHHRQHARRCRRDCQLRAAGTAGEWVIHYSFRPP